MCECVKQGAQYGGVRVRVRVRCVGVMLTCLVSVVRGGDLLAPGGEKERPLVLREKRAVPVCLYHWQLDR